MVARRKRIVQANPIGLAAELDQLHDLELFSRVRSLHDFESESRHDANIQKRIVIHIANGRLERALVSRRRRDLGSAYGEPATSSSQHAQIGALIT